MIEVKNLFAGYKKEPVLRDVSCRFEKGKITAILGQSGSGKSTLVKCFNRIIEDDGGFINGSILIDGEDIFKKKKEELRKEVSIVFQDPLAFPFSILKNISFLLEYHKGLSKEGQRKRAVEILELVGLYDEVSDRLDDKATKLSGGQKQRLSIARSLSVDPSLLILDEPCSALDLKNTLAIEELLVKLKENYTIIIATHNLGQAKRIADNIIYLDEGRIIETAGKDEFFKNPKNELVKIQLEMME
ncbi:MAG: ATP-binding cassette domain-containing protein [Tissierellia bacterium]|nr:ATP-binding cassette domain-containing protein [Tissierellia bacterium]